MYYVTLCVKTATVTKAIPWFYNAKFETLSAAQNYKSSLIPLVNKINSSPPQPKRIPNIEGERILVITGNPSPDIYYQSKGDEIESKPLDNLKDNEHTQKSGKNAVPSKSKTRKATEYVQLYHGPKVKKSTAIWLQRKQDDASRFFLVGLGLLVLFGVLTQCS
jgi:hypothetical protein